MMFKRRSNFFFDLISKYIFLPVLIRDIEWMNVRVYARKRESESSYMTYTPFSQSKFIWMAKNVVSSKQTIWIILIQILGELGSGPSKELIAQ